MQDAEKLDEPNVTRTRGRLAVLALATVGSMVVLSRLLPTILTILLG
jgi:hypothetical protein